MNKKNTIDLIFIEQQELEPEFDNNMFPIGKDLKRVARKIQKETITNSLNNLINDVGEILEKVESNPYTRIELDQLSIAVELNAEGGIAWIANANTSVTNSIVLTFKIKQSK